MEEVFLRLFKSENVFSEYQGILSIAKKKIKIKKYLHGKMVRETKKGEEAWVGLGNVIWWLEWKFCVP